MPKSEKISLVNQFFYAVNPRYGLSIDCKTHVISVDVEKICEKHRKTFDELCQDENIINQILDTYSEMRKIYQIKAPCI